MFSSFMLDTWIAASIVALVAGLVGFFVVIRGAAFPAHALPMTAFPGAAVALLLGIDQRLGLLLFAAIGIAGISRLERRGRPEIATALSLVTLLGVGALLLSMTRAYEQAVYGLLFGEVLAVSDADLLPLAALGAVAALLTLLLFRPLLLSALAPELAQALGISTARIELLFLTILALATAMALPVVGALLVFSLMVGPASAARMLTDRPLAAMLLSAALSLLTVWAAIALSFLSDWPVGFFVGTLAALAYAAGRARPAARRRTAPA